ncbi:MAG: DNA translocase FtsK 4TM domain-containing protein, partial [Actinobacteria bacterium]|nr:DNA translocase FtsK 4TM domain-containing protein [Actinomycetota bacterium]
MAPTSSTRTRQPASKKASGPGRSRTGSSAPANRSRAAARPASRPAARQPRRQPALAVVGRLVAQLWRALGAAVGTLARAVGRNAATARELDPAHRRDGAGLAVLALGLISAIAVWFAAAGPLGEAITGLFRLLVGNLALLLPVLLVAWAVHLLRQQPHPERRGRLLVGGLAVLLAVTGMLHLAADSPTNETGWSHAGGVTGMLAGELERLLPASLVVLVLFLLGAFGVLVVTGTPLNELPGLVRDLLARPVHDDELPDRAPARRTRVPAGAEDAPPPEEPEP